MPDDKFN
jgi:dynein heavy chain, axonemal